MSKKKFNLDREDSESRGSRLGVVGVAFWTGLCLVLILYVGFFFMTRTEGFRSYLSEYFAGQLGMPVTIGSSHSDWGMNIELSDFSAGDTNSPSPAGMRIGKAKLDWSLKDLMRPKASAIKGLTIEYAQIGFAMNPRGVWEPAALGPLSGMLDKWSGGRLKTPAPSPGGEPSAGDGGKKEEEKEKKSALRMDRINLDLSDSRIVWWGANREELAVIDGLRITVTPLVLPNRTARHYHLTADSVRVLNGVRADRLDIEILETEGQNIVLGFKADWDKSARRSGSAGHDAITDDELRSISGALRDAMNSPE